MVSGARAPRGTRRLLAGRVAASLLAASVLVVSAAGTARASSDATISGLQVQAGVATFTVSVTQLPAGARLDPTRTVVRIGGQVVEAQAETVGTPAPGKPRTAVLVVDTSGSMGPAGIAAARDAALAYSTRVAPDVRVGLVGFADRPRLVTPPTTDRAALRTGLAGLRASGETALYDAVAMGVRAAGAGGAVVVLSDGADTVSTADLRRTLSTVRASGVQVNTVAFRTQDSVRGPLDQIARAGGGRVVAAAGARDLAAAFTDAAASLSAQLRLRVTVPSGTAAGAPVSVQLVAGTARWDASGTLPADPAATTAAAAPAAPTATLVGQVPWYASLRLLLAVVFVGLVLTALLVLHKPDDAAARRRQALDAYSLAGRHSSAGSSTGSAESGAATGVVNLSERYVQHRGSSDRLTLALERAGSRLRPAEWVVLRVCTVLAAVAVLSVLTHNLLAGILLGVLLGWVGTWAWLRRRQSRRARAFSDTLPDTLQLVASSLRTGFSLPQALDAAQQDGPEPIASELGRALAAARIGAPLEDELELVAERTTSEDWRWAVMAIRIQRSVGGNLAEVLLTTVHTLRERAATRRQVRALSAEGRLSAYILIGLPLVISGFLFLFRREYVRPLWTSVPGIGMVVVAVLLLLVGSWWMRKVVTVEV